MRDVIERGDLPALGAPAPRGVPRQEADEPATSPRTRRSTRCLRPRARPARSAARSAAPVAAATCSSRRARARSRRCVPGWKALGGQFAPFAFTHGRRPGRAGATSAGRRPREPPVRARRPRRHDHRGAAPPGDPDQLALIPGAAEALGAPARGPRHGHRRGHQPGRGRARQPDPRAARARSTSACARCSPTQGRRVDAILVCPHRPEDGCDCRKPGTGIALEAAAALRVRPRGGVRHRRSRRATWGWAGRSGATTIFVRTGHGREEEAAAGAARRPRRRRPRRTPRLSSPDSSHGRRERGSGAGTRTRAETYLRDAADRDGRGCDDRASRTSWPRRRCSWRRFARTEPSSSAATAAAPPTPSTWRPSSSARSRSIIHAPRCARSRSPPTPPRSPRSRTTSAPSGCSRGRWRRSAGAGDVLLAISTSGNSPNVLAAAETARRRRRSALSRSPGGGWRRWPRWPMWRFVCPPRETGHVQECHLAVEQLLALLAERELYPDPEPDPRRPDPA